MSSIKEKYSKIFPTGGVKKVTDGLTKATNIANIVGTAADVVGSFLPEKTEYSGTKGDITKTMDSAYDTISNTAMMIPGFGTLAGGIMKGAKLLG